MLAKIKGTIIDVFPDFIVIDNSGMGYRVETAEKDYLLGQAVDLFIHTHVRETELRLFGFRRREQFLLFSDLLEISGVGPKLALTLLNSLTFDVILNSIESKDVSTLKVKGLGEKTAQRIVIDMFPKLNNYIWLHTEKGMSFSEDFISQATDALMNLGFARNEIKNTLKEYSEDADRPEDLSILVKYALKNLRVKKDTK